jgi:hypothetical protein
VLERGDTVYVFDRGQPVRLTRIVDLVDGKQAERIFSERRFDDVYEDKPLWDSIGCYWGLRAERSRWLARYGKPDSEGLPVAIKGLPPHSRVIGGDFKRLDEQTLHRILRGIEQSIPTGFRGTNVLRAGRRFRSGPRDEIVEILLGKPFGASEPFDSVQICAVTTLNGRVVDTGYQSRVTGVEERVDTEAPTLDRNSWFEIQEESIGFFSTDSGASWNRIVVNVGFEGIAWTIHRLSKGSPLLWDHYLYIPH